ncbi:MAG: hypothetical protein SFT68_03285 [Rickettsiaceae bacterium]|nr:hypothetical protein [Rickettsiaceae bacterium]
MRIFIVISLIMYNVIKGIKMFEIEESITTSVKHKQNKSKLKVLDKNLDHTKIKYLLDKTKFGNRSSALSSGTVRIFAELQGNK